MRPMPELKVERVPVDDLYEYRNNAKIHSHEQIDQIAASISEFGFDNPVLAWHNAEGDAEIVAGHGRVAAARKLGIGTVPVIYLDHLEDSQRRALTHVLNQTTLSSGFDLEILDMEMDELDFDWDGFGFDTVDFDLDSIFSTDPKPDEDEGEEEAPTMVTCPHCGKEFEV